MVHVYLLMVLCSGVMIIFFSSLHELKIFLSQTYLIFNLTNQIFWTLQKKKKNEKRRWNKTWFFFFSAWIFKNLKPSISDNSLPTKYFEPCRKKKNEKQRWKKDEIKLNYILLCMNLRKSLAKHIWYFLTNQLFQTLQKKKRIRKK